MTHLLIWMLAYPVVAAIVMRLRSPIESHTDRTLHRADWAHFTVYTLGIAILMTLHIANV